MLKVKLAIANRAVEEFPAEPGSVNLSALASSEELALIKALNIDMNATDMNTTMPRTLKFELAVVAKCPTLKTSKTSSLLY
uniref:Uncharacterized protein n=1 Tax=Sarcoptes scabiei TaxID=52283 RepID=A0A834RIH2_SARSC